MNRSAVQYRCVVLGCGRLLAETFNASGRPLFVPQRQGSVPEVGWGTSPSPYAEGRAVWLDQTFEVTEFTNPDDEISLHHPMRRQLWVWSTTRLRLLTDFNRAASGLVVRLGEDDLQVWE